jgi:hypothetical protein
MVWFALRVAIVFLFTIAQSTNQNDVSELPDDPINFWGFLIASFHHRSIPVNRRRQILTRLGSSSA